MKKYLPLLAAFAFGCAVPAAEPLQTDNLAIVGGQEADPGEYPYAVSFVRGSWQQGLQFCGGVVIKKDWIMTAGHCLEKLRTDKSTVDWHVAVGLHDIADFQWHLDDPDSPFVPVTKDDITIHEDYEELSGQFGTIARNDVGLVHLPGIGSDLAEDQFPSFATQTPSSGTELWAIGYGALNEDESSSGVLHDVAVPLLSDWQCNVAHDDWLDGYNDYLMKTMMCAGSMEGGIDFCFGDSGGPLIRKIEGEQDEVVGIISWSPGEHCALEGKPGVYTEVAEFADWIEETISE